MSNIESTASFKNSLKRTLPPGARIEVRNEEWLVRSCVFDESIGSFVVKAEGTSGVARGLQMTFLDTLDKIKEVDPLQIDFKVDDSSNFRRTKLFIDMWIKKSTPTTSELVIGHRGVFNNEPYQREPASKALDQNKHLRPRVLMADAVGLGKTIQVGILLSELIRRGKGQRILVVCLKSMMSQFQKELWSRFTIPLKALDSQKVEQVFREIPSRMNPFNYHDKVIISMDTLKTTRMMGYLDSAHWDVIVIDECHNVARRGKSSSHRSKLAKKLSAASDALILTSATPHDGTKESYSSLLELLDPTLVTDPNKITKDDLVKAEVVFRRFGKDLDLENKIPPRREDPRYIAYSKEEEIVLSSLKGKVFKVLDERKTRKKDVFFRSTLSKAIFSSPDAFISSVEERLKKIDPKISPAHKEDYDFLKELKDQFGKNPIKKTPKYKELLSLLTSKDGIGKKDRVVIFTEFRKTQEALIAALEEDLELKTAASKNTFDAKAEILSFNASVSEEDQQKIIESFASENSKIKILVTTDIASEGVNLHFYCNHLVHYDVPWSLITLEQRNGRIDRYGQKKEPKIIYLVGDSKDSSIEKMKERWVVEKLLDRARNVREQLGDESLALGCFDEEKETEKIAITYQEEEDLNKLFDANSILDDIFGSITPENKASIAVADIKTLNSEMDFILSACKELGIKHKHDGNELSIGLGENPDSRDGIIHSLRFLSNELEVDDKATLKLSNSISVVQEAIAKSRKKAGEWPEFHYLWENHPVSQLFLRQLEGTFDKDTVPCVVMDESEKLKDVSFLVYGAIFNKKGQPIHSQLSFAYQKNEKWIFEEPFEALKGIGFDKKSVVNRSDETTFKKIKKSEKGLLKTAGLVLGSYRNELSKEAIKEYNKRTPKLQEYSAKLKEWHSSKTNFLHETLKTESQKRRLQEELAASERVKNKFQDYIRSQFEVETDSPFIRIVAAFIPNNGDWS